MKELKADNKPFEVVFVSSDQSEKKMMDYMAPVRIFRRIFEDRTKIQQANSCRVLNRLLSMQFHLELVPLSKRLLTNMI